MTTTCNALPVQHAAPFAPITRTRWLSRCVSALWCMLALLLGSAVSTPAAAAGPNGLWTTGSGDYMMVLQDTTSGTTFALQVSPTLESMRIWSGPGSASTVSLAGLLQPADTLQATLSGNAMSGTLTVGGQAQAFSAQLALAWVSSEHAGIWQRSVSTNAYMLFALLDTGTARLGVQIDVTLRPDGGVDYDIYTGTLTQTVFNGLSIVGTGVRSRLEFGDGTLQGSYTTSARPPVVTAFTATQIVRTAP